VIAGLPVPLLLFFLVEVCLSRLCAEMHATSLPGSPSAATVDIVKNELSFGGSGWHKITYHLNTVALAKQCEENFVDQCHPSQIEVSTICKDAQAHVR
jgi:hypothetical protein